MKARQLLSDSLAPLAPEDSAETALAALLEQGVAHLPVVGAGGALLGLVSEEQLLEASNAEVPVRALLRARPVSVAPEAHVFDATRAMVRHDLSVLPVAEPAGTSNSARADDLAASGDDGAEEAPHYLGVVRRHDLFEQFARMLSTQEPGAILALESEERDYSLGQLVHLIEQSDAKVLSISSEPAAPRQSGEDVADVDMPPLDVPANERIGTRRITVKLNTTNTTRVRHMLEHHGFDIVASFGEQDEQVLERVQEFMRYLEV